VRRFVNKLHNAYKGIQTKNIPSKPKLGDHVEVGDVFVDEFNVVQCVTEVKSLAFPGATTNPRTVIHGPAEKADVLAFELKLASKRKREAPPENTSEVTHETLPPKKRKKTA
jgi:hypothetical protein